VRRPAANAGGGDATCGPRKARDGSDASKPQMIDKQAPTHIGLKGVRSIIIISSRGRGWECDRRAL